MYERCLHEAERILATHKDVIVPVKQVWREVSEEGKKQEFEVPTLADFTAMLEGDLRFVFVPARENGLEPDADEMSDQLFDDRDEMEKLGFFADDRVQLRRVSLPSDMGSLAGDAEEEERSFSRIMPRGTDKGSVNRTSAGSLKSGRRSPRERAQTPGKQAKKKTRKSKPAKKPAGGSGVQRRVSKRSSTGTGRKRRS